ncbi:PadR family transcriptional regulator [Halomarina pelagica]|uniref:PadR family transcriptional regulator n=1 Tax=Halomarina pelagica TaxID=2961599 RepID=UPI0020C3C470|nr:PadR family transcriptional regulator [Halomarina sp. BND7]
MTLFDLTGFQRDLLYVLVGLEHPSGQRIKTELDSVSEYEPSDARLYSNLDVLVLQGYVEKETADQRTNSYALTEQGYEALAARQEWKDTYLPFTSPIQS